jgi:hypothetical protein
MGFEDDIRARSLMLALCVAALGFLLWVSFPGTEAGEGGFCVVIDRNATYCESGRIHVFIRNTCDYMVQFKTPDIYGTGPDLFQLAGKACIYGKTKIVLQPGQGLACTNYLLGRNGTNSIWAVPSPISSTSSVEC